MLGLEFVRPSRRQWILLGAVTMGLLARVPGVFWGANFPTGWTSHHIDEYTHLSVVGCIVNPVALHQPSAAAYIYGCASYYPKGTAAHVAALLLAVRAVQGKLAAPLPTPEVAIVTGRVIVVLYGVATILVVFLLANMFFPAQPAVGYLAAYFIALGGLHVSQSHFFLADIPAIFWVLSGLYLLGRCIEGGENANPHYLNAAAFCLGVAIGVKLSILALPSLALTCLLARPRLVRLIYSAVFLVAGFCIISMDAYSAYDLYGMLRSYSVVGLHGYHFSRLASAGIYAVELPTVISLPIALLGLAGTVLLSRRLFQHLPRDRMQLIWLVAGFPNLIALGLVLFRYDNAPRHLLPFVPWLAITAAWSLNELAEYLARRHIPRYAVIAPVFLYLGLFVFDGEKVFWKDPRNEAERWLLEHVPKGTRITVMGTWRSHFAPPGYEYSDYPSTPPADYIVAEMHYANMFLSGMGWRDSYPQDNSTVFPWFDDHGEHLHMWQAVFRGTSPYRECAAFSEGYFMPEFVWSDRLVGNRMGNFVGEVLIFHREEPQASFRTIITAG